LTINRAFHWIRRGCEIGVYPYVIPFTGAAMAQDPALSAHACYETLTVPGTNVSWRQVAKLLPADPTVRAAILSAEARVQSDLIDLSRELRHLPSRVRSLLWIACIADELRALGQRVPARDDIERAIARHLPASHVKHRPAIVPDRSSLAVAYDF